MAEEDVLKSVFDKFDRDKVGSLSYVQFTSMISSLSKHVPELKDVQIDSIMATFQLFDLDHDERVSYDEFKKWWMSIDRYSYLIGEKAKLLKKAYRLYMRYSRDKKMAYNDFDQMMTDLGLPCTEEEYDSLTDSTDGILNFAKFCRWLNWF